MIKVKDFIQMAFSYEEGMLLRERMLNELKNEAPLTVDFEGITVFTTMFFNACSGHFVFANSLEWYQQNFKVINLNPLGEETHKHSIENAQRRNEKTSNSINQITQDTIDENA